MRQYLSFGFLLYAHLFTSCKKEIKETKTIPEGSKTDTTTGTPKKPVMTVHL